MSRMFAALAVALALALLVVACGGASGDETTPAASPTPADTTTETATPEATATGAADGALLFADNCAGCHNADGSGGTGPDLRAEDDVQKVVEKVTTGGGQMPSFEGQLSPEEIQAVAGYAVNQL